MDFKIVFSDIDGTILNSEHRMLKGTLDAIFADKSRLSILKSLMVEDMYVERLAERLELTSATVSFHLKKLEDAGAVKSYKDQYYTMYSINKELFEVNIVDILNEKTSLLLQ